MEHFFTVSVITTTIIRLMFLCILQGGVNEGQVSGVNRSVEDQESATSLPNGLPDLECPEKIGISWFQAAPFVFSLSKDHNDGKQSEENTAPTLKGVFVDVVKHSLPFCLKKMCSSAVPDIRFAERSTNLRSLQLQFLDGKADMIMPVYSDEMTKYGGKWPFVKILESPGVVLIQRHAAYREKLVLKAVQETWPVIILALSMSFVAGVVIWRLDSSQNSEQFPHTFHRGIFQGFWWAFVTITTVGYGDKAPKSTLARSFAVVWMTVGVTICSVMTASLSSALTNVKLDEDSFRTGKRIGLLKDDVAFQDAISMAANITTFENADEMFDSLENGDRIDGIVMEMFSGIASLKMTTALNQQFVIAKVIWNKRPFGIAYRDDWFFNIKDFSDCFSNVIKLKRTDVLQTVNRYTQLPEVVSNGHIMKVLDFQSTTFQLCMVVLLLLLFVFLVGGRVIILIKDHISKRPQHTNNPTVEQKSSQSEVQDPKTSPPVCLDAIQETEV